MIEITDGFTSISTDSDSNQPPRTAEGRGPTGVRVTLAFCRETALASGEDVLARYELADAGLCTVIGTAKPTHTVVSQGKTAIYHYRMSHWIPNSNVRQRTDHARSGKHHLESQSG